MSRVYPEEARKGLTSFSMFPLELAALGNPNAVTLMVFGLGKSDNFIHSSQSLQRQLHLSRSQVESGLKYLMARGWVTRQDWREGGKNKTDYTFHYPAVPVADAEDDESSAVGSLLLSHRSGPTAAVPPQRSSRCGETASNEVRETTKEDVTKQDRPKQELSSRAARGGPAAAVSPRSSRGQGSSGLVPMADRLRGKRKEPRQYRDLWTVDEQLLAKGDNQALRMADANTLLSFTAESAPGSSLDPEPYLDYFLAHLDCSGKDRPTDSQLSRIADVIQAALAQGEEDHVLVSGVEHVVWGTGGSEPCREPQKPNKFALFLGEHLRTGKRDTAAPEHAPKFAPERVA